jgi:predicted nucleic acid-binding protein
LIVVDSNVLAYLLIEGEQTPQAAAVWRLDPEWCLPVLWRHEFLNILATYVKAGGADIADVEEVWREALRLAGPGEHEGDPIAALRLAVRHKISAYDAQFVALAQQLEIPLVTEDRRLRAAFPGQFLSMQAFCESRSR